MIKGAGIGLDSIRAVATKFLVNPLHEAFSSRTFWRVWKRNDGLPWKCPLGLELEI